MKYLVLAGEDYYPEGGADAKFSSDDMLAAVIRAKSYLVEPVNGSDKYAWKSDWAEVVDTSTLGIVWSSRDD